MIQSKSFTFLESGLGTLHIHNVTDEANGIPLVTFSQGDKLPIGEIIPKTDDFFDVCHEVTIRFHNEEGLDVLIGALQRAKDYFQSKKVN